MQFNVKKNIIFHILYIIVLLYVGLKRLVDIVDNVDNKKLSTNILVVE